MIPVSPSTGKDKRRAAQQMTCNFIRVTRLTEVGGGINGMPRRNESSLILSAWTELHCCCSRLTGVLYRFVPRHEQASFQKELMRGDFPFARLFDSEH